MIEYLAQLLISLLRYDVDEAGHVSTKFIKKSLRNLTETVVVGAKGAIRHVFSNFDDLNKAIMRKCGAISREITPH